MRALIQFTKRHPWMTNVTIYGSLFASADIVQQKLSKAPHEPIDFKQTAKVGIVGFCFHANFNFFWLRFIERTFPGSAPLNVIRKVACDQLMAAPITISAFYTGLSILDGEKDIFKNLKEKFWPTYKTGVVCWTVFQICFFLLFVLVLYSSIDNPLFLKWLTIKEGAKIQRNGSKKTINFSLIPPFVRTAYIGVCAFLWTTFLCYIRNKDIDQVTSRLLQTLPSITGKITSQHEADNKKPPAK